MMGQLFTNLVGVSRKYLEVLIDYEWSPLLKRLLQDYPTKKIFKLSGKEILAYNFSAKGYNHSYPALYRKTDKYAKVKMVPLLKIK